MWTKGGEDRRRRALGHIATSLPAFWLEGRQRSTETEQRGTEEFRSVETEVISAKLPPPEPPHHRSHVP